MSAGVSAKQLHNLLSFPSTVHHSPMAVAVSVDRNNIRWAVQDALVFVETLLNS